MNFSEQLEIIVSKDFLLERLIIYQNDKPFSDKLGLLQCFLRLNDALSKMLLLLEILDVELADHINSAGDVLAREQDEFSGDVSHAHSFACFGEVSMGVSKSRLELSFLTFEMLQNLKIKLSVCFEITRIFL